MKAGWVSQQSDECEGRGEIGWQRNEGEGGGWETRGK